jgi:hypothetical protein
MVTTRMVERGVIRNIHRFAFLAASMATVALAAPASAGGSLGFTNGSFESGGPAPFTASTPGWGAWLGPASAGSDYGIALAGAAPKTAEDGSYYAYFHATDSITDCIGEELSTVVGQKYLVSFWVATDGPTSSSSSLLQVVWGPDFSTTPSDVAVNAFQPASASALPYQHITLTFTAVTTHDILAFHGFDAASDILLDNITVTPASSVPAMGPRLVALLAALLAAGAFGIIRRTPDHGGPMA